MFSVVLDVSHHLFFKNKIKFLILKNEKLSFFAFLLPENAFSPNRNLREEE
jgi:hypothetical protein